jgi:hypothetical protein
MLRNLEELQHYAINATDGVIGKVTDVLFSDKDWVARYLIVDTGNWLFSRKVLISPIAITGQYWSKEALSVELTQEQVKNSPDIDTHKPVSRQHELDYFSYYGFPIYWGGAGMWGEGSFPNGAMAADEGVTLSPNAEQAKAFALTQAKLHQNDDPNLNSANTVIGYHIEAIDGEIGHVKGLLLDEKTWAIRYLIVDTSNWWIGHSMLITPDLIKNIEWVSSRVHVNLTRQAVRDAPLYDSTLAIDRKYEEAIYKHFGLTEYWSESSAQKNRRNSKKVLKNLRIGDLDLEDSPPAISELPISAEERDKMIATEAYFGAYARSFGDGDPVEDWLVAEKKVDAQLV